MSKKWSIGGGHLLEHGRLLEILWYIYMLKWFIYYSATFSPYYFLAHLSRRLIGELIVYRSSRRACVRPFTLSNMNISATSWPIGMKFYLKHHWGGRKASVCFDPDRIKTLVSMATDSSHRVIMG